MDHGDEENCAGLDSFGLDSIEIAIDVNGSSAAYDLHNSKLAEAVKKLAVGQIKEGYSKSEIVPRGLMIGKNAKNSRLMTSEGVGVFPGASASTTTKNARYGGFNDAILSECAPKCPGHGMVSKLLTVKKSGPNLGRKFYGCTFPADQRCKFFLWAEDNPNLLPLVMAQRRAEQEYFTSLFCPPSSSTTSATDVAVSGLKDIKSSGNEVQPTAITAVGAATEKAEKATWQYSAVRSYVSRLEGFAVEELKQEIRRARTRRQLSDYGEDTAGSGEKVKLTLSGTRAELIDRLAREAVRSLALTTSSLPSAASVPLVPYTSPLKGSGSRFAVAAAGVDDVASEQSEDCSGDSCGMIVFSDDDDENSNSNRNSHNSVKLNQSKLEVERVTWEQEILGKSVVPQSRSVKIRAMTRKEVKANEEVEKNDEDWMSVSSSSSSSVSDFVPKSKRRRRNNAVGTSRTTQENKETTLPITKQYTGNCKNKDKNIKRNNINEKQEAENNSEVGAGTESSVLLQLLRQHFGFTCFRPGQLWASQRVLAGQRSLLILPTGAGKTLCYMLPSLALPGLTVVVSPLLALMQDQIKRLPVHLPGACLSGNVSVKAAAEITADVLMGHVKVLFVSPERLCTQSFRRLIRSLNEKRYSSSSGGGAVSLLCVDEAHCVSQWSYNFRPAYLRLGREIRAMAPRAVLALTATAPPHVQMDVMSNFDIPADGKLALSPLRPNLHYFAICVDNSSNGGSGGEDNGDSNEGHGVCEDKRQLLVKLLKSRAFNLDAPTIAATAFTSSSRRLDTHRDNVFDTRMVNAAETDTTASHAHPKTRVVAGASLAQNRAWGGVSSSIAGSSLGRATGSSGGNDGYAMIANRQRDKYIVRRRPKRPLSSSSSTCYAPSAIAPTSLSFNKKSRDGTRVKGCGENSDNATTTVPTIVYVWRREEADSVAEYLRANGLPAISYHAGMDADQRTRAQNMFLRSCSARETDSSASGLGPMTSESGAGSTSGGGSARIMVATVAFGMGVDKSDVRRVVHFCAPKSVENYMQETGRAGRDSFPSACVTLLDPADTLQQLSLTHKHAIAAVQVYSLLRRIFLAPTPRSVSADRHIQNTVLLQQQQEQKLQQRSLLLDDIERTIDIPAATVETVLSILESAPFHCVVVDGVHLDCVQGHFRASLSSPGMQCDPVIAALVKLCPQNQNYKSDHSNSTCGIDTTSTTSSLCSDASRRTEYGLGSSSGFSLGEQATAGAGKMGYKANGASAAGYRREFSTRLSLLVTALCEASFQEEPTEHTVTLDAAAGKQGACCSSTESESMTSSGRIAHKCTHIYTRESVGKALYALQKKGWIQYSLSRPAITFALSESSLSNLSSRSSENIFPGGYGSNSVCISDVAVEQQQYRQQQEEERVWDLAARVHAKLVSLEREEGKRVGDMWDVGHFIATHTLLMGTSTGAADCTGVSGPDTSTQRPTAAAYDIANIETLDSSQEAIEQPSLTASYQQDAIRSLLCDRLTEQQATPVPCVITSGSLSHPCRHPLPVTYVAPINSQSHGHVRSKRAGGNAARQAEQQTALKEALCLSQDARLVGIVRGVVLSTLSGLTQLMHFSNEQQQAQIARLRLSEASAAAGADCENDHHLSNCHGIDSNCNDKASLHASGAANGDSAGCSSSGISQSQHHMSKATGVVVAVCTDRGITAAAPATTTASSFVNAQFVDVLSLYATRVLHGLSTPQLQRYGRRVDSSSSTAGASGGYWDGGDEVPGGGGLVGGFENFWGRYKALDFGTLRLAVRQAITNQNVRYFR